MHGIPQVDDRYPITVVFFRNSTIISCQVPLRIQGENTHSAGTGILQVGIQEEGSLTHTAGPNHEAVDVVAVHKSVDRLVRPEPFWDRRMNSPAKQMQLRRHRRPSNRTKDQPLGLGTMLTGSPHLRRERNILIGLGDLLWSCPTCGSILTISHRAALDVVKCVVLGEHDQSADYNDRSRGKQNQRPYIVLHRITSFPLPSLVLAFPVVHIDHRSNPSAPESDDPRQY